MTMDTTPVFCEALNCRALPQEGILLAQRHDAHNQSERQIRLCSTHARQLAKALLEVIDDFMYTPDK